MKTVYRPLSFLDVEIDYVVPFCAKSYKNLYIYLIGLVKISLVYYWRLVFLGTKSTY